MSITMPISHELDENEALFRDLYTRILARSGPAASSILGVTSVVTGEGKTTVAMNLAITFVNDRSVVNTPDETESQVLIIDCNPEHHGAAHDLESEATPGLVQFLRDEAPLEAVIKQTLLDRLWLLPVGGDPTDFSALIRTTAMRELKRTLSRRYSLIIFDLPAILSTSDTQVLTGLAEHVLLVVRAGATPSTIIPQALQQLDRKKLVGVVLNDWKQEVPNWIRYRL